jgi:sugar fermentation stimulation protein A
MKKMKLYPLLSIENPQECRIVERLNRFVVRIEIQGRFHLAHINNTGRLLEYMVRGQMAYCLPYSHPKKTEFRLFALKEGESGALIDTQFQMRAFEKAVIAGLVPWLERCRIIRRNARLGSSLLDYLLECRKNPLYCEVKSAVLREGGFALYPDCPSLRGQRHIKEISSWTREGGRGIIVFMAALPDVEAFKPNHTADPVIHELLIKATQIGVQVKAIQLYYDPVRAVICLFNPDLPVILF